SVSLAPSSAGGCSAAPTTSLASTREGALFPSCSRPSWAHSCSWWWPARSAEASAGAAPDARAAGSDRGDRLGDKLCQARVYMLDSSQLAIVGLKLHGGGHPGGDIHRTTASHDT